MKNLFTLSLMLVGSGMVLILAGVKAPILILLLGIGWIGLFSSGAVLLKCHFTINHVCKCCRESWSVITMTRKAVESTQMHLCPDCRKEAF